MWNTDFVFMSRLNVTNDYENHKMSATHLVALQCNSVSTSIGLEIHAVQM
jgi:hypothetical protein